MKIHRLTSQPARDVAKKLSEFEKEFRYPLGESASFTISHGEDYMRFFRSMGKAVVYLAEISGEIIGAQAVVERTIKLEDGSTIPAAYLCDTKIIAKMRGGMVLGRLAMAAFRDIQASGIQAGFSVVMDGSKTSDQHTGRLGIPQFKELSRLAILQFDTAAVFKGFSKRTQFSLPACHHPFGVDQSLCSEMVPLALSVDGASCLLVDTLRGKRLWASNGAEMLSAHLTALQFSSFSSLSILIQSAMNVAAEMSIPRLFVALPESICPMAILQNATDGCATLASARVYGAGLPKGNWIVNTSEI